MKIVKESLEAKSVHIFCWPFRFDKDKFIIDKNWNKIDIFNEKIDYTNELFKDSYMLDKYLTASAKKIFQSSSANPCEVYDYGNLDNYDYVIETIEKTYSLPIVSIELHKYSFGVGILFIQVINCNPDYTMEDIKKINDLGRRVDIPFIPEVVENGFMLSSEKIEIISSEKVLASTDFREILKKSAKEQTKINDLNVSFGAQILFGKEEFESKLKQMKIEPFSDDRMFLISMIRDKKLSKLVKKGYEKDKELDKYLYSIIFVDPSDATCQDETMRKELLDAAIYRRWLDYGTLYAITNYSFLCITSESEDINSSVVRPFLVQYSYFISLVLAQSMGIFSFSERANLIAQSLEQSQLNEKQNDIIKLQESYITFKNQFMLLRISTQDQGIEIYRHMQKQLNVFEEKLIFDNELGSLYDIVQINIESNTAQSANTLSKFGNGIAKKAFWIAVLAVIFSAISVIVAIIQLFTF